ncbi:MAG: hypothetical protein GX028_10035 [Clostridiaceae bacterium]|nr:hypothetical protein [Clostridiaceae bacterium]
MRRRFDLRGFGVLIAVAVSIMIIAAISSSLARIEERSRQAGLETARRAVSSSALQCYALEGSYPVDLSYLAENYGLQLQEEKYVYLYQSFGGNLKPVIEVIER